MPTKSDFAVGLSEFRTSMSTFDARMARFEARMDAFERRMDAMEARFDAKLEAMRADIRAEVKASQVQNLMWLSGIVLASNGVVIALLGRIAHVY